MILSFRSLSSMLRELEFLSLVVLESLAIFVPLRFSGKVIIFILCDHFDLNIFSRPEMSSSFNRLLVFLAVLDSLFIGTCIWDNSCVRVWGVRLEAYVYMFPYIWYPGKNILLSWSSYLIMGISTERYLAVCRYVH